MSVRQLVDEINQVINQFEKDYGSNLLCISPKKINTPLNHLSNLIFIITTVRGDLTKINNQLLKLTRKLITSDYCLQPTIKTINLTHCCQFNQQKAIQLKEIKTNSELTLKQIEDNIDEINKIYEELIEFHKKTYQQLKVAVNQIPIK